MGPDFRKGFCTSTCAYITTLSHAFGTPACAKPFPKIVPMVKLDMYPTTEFCWFLQYLFPFFRTISWGNSSGCNIHDFYYPYINTWGWNKLSGRVMVTYTNVYSNVYQSCHICINWKLGFIKTFKSRTMSVGSLWQNEFWIHSCCDYQCILHHCKGTCPSLCTIIWYWRTFWKLQGKWWLLPYHCSLDCYLHFTAYIFCK